MDEHIFITGLSLLGAICLGIFSFHRHMREHNELAPRMVPWMIISLGCIATGFMLAVHLVNLFGFTTGQG